MRSVGLNHTSIGIEHVGTSDAQIPHDPRQLQTCSISRSGSPNGSTVASTRDRALLAAAVVLMVGGVVLLLADVASGAVTIPLMTVGIALVVIAEIDAHHRRGGGIPRGVEPRERQHPLRGHSGTLAQPKVLTRDPHHGAVAGRNRKDHGPSGPGTLDLGIRTCCASARSPRPFTRRR